MRVASGFIRLRCVSGGTYTIEYLISSDHQTDRSETLCLCLHYCATMVVIFPHWRKKCVAVILFFLHLCFLPRSSQHLLFWIGRIKCNLANKYHNNKHQNKNLTSIKNRNSIQRTKLLNRPTLLGSHLMINSAVNG